MQYTPSPARGVSEGSVDGNASLNPTIFWTTQLLSMCTGRSLGSLRFEDPSYKFQNEYRRKEIDYYLWRRVLLWIFGIFKRFLQYAFVTLKVEYKIKGTVFEIIIISFCSKKGRNRYLRFVVREMDSYYSNWGPYVSDIWSGTCNC